jgi:acetylornithine deacetylase
MIAAFSQLAKTEQPYNLIMLASAEEEVTGVNGVRAVLPELGKIDFAIVGEPTGMNPAVAEKGLMVLDCTAYGVAGHAAREEGVNAIYKALKDIEWFRTHRFERVSPMLGPVKMSVTGVQAGTQHNVVPAECKFMVDVRVNECYQNEELLGLIREAVECDVQPRSTHLNSSAIALDHPAVERLVNMGRVPFGSPTMSNQAVMPFTTLKLGPGDSARSHTADEYILLSEIAEAVEMYVALLDKLRIRN